MRILPITRTAAVLCLRFLAPAILVALALLPGDSALAATTVASASVDSAEAQATGGYSNNPSTSADGRYVAFASTSMNLVAGDTNGQQDVFVRDRAGGDNGTGERESAGAQANSLGPSYAPSISADGRYVAFRSLASNLVAGTPTSLLTSSCVIARRGRLRG